MVPTGAFFWIIAAPHYYRIRLYGPSTHRNLHQDSQCFLDFRNGKYRKIKATTVIEIVLKNKKNERSVGIE